MLASDADIRDKDDVVFISTGSSLSALLPSAKQQQQQIYGDVNGLTSTFHIILK